MTYICKTENEKKRFYIERFCGDCLYRLGIHASDGGYAVIDRNADFRVGDVVECTMHLGMNNSFLKQVKEINGDSVTVGTAYADASRDFTFEAAEIYGVVLETYERPHGFREYKRGE